MAETSTHEPTMEEILASIRRIISEDDTPEEVEAADEPEPEPEVEAEPEPFMAAEPEPEEEMVELVEEEDVLELTEMAHPPATSLGDLDIYDAPVVVPVPEPAPAPRPAPRVMAPEPAAPKPALVSDFTAHSAASAFGALNSALLMPKSGYTLEDFMKDMMRPMLQSWLDENLPSIVEEQVRQEVERISRQART